MTGPLNALAQECHEIAVSKGFYDDTLDDTPRGVYAEIGLKLALIHSEATEILEAVRKGRGDDAEAEEVADLQIRLLDYVAMRDIDLDAAVAAKMEKNRSRPHLHGHAF